MAIPDSPAPSPAPRASEVTPIPPVAATPTRTVDIVIGNSPPSSPTPAPRVVNAAAAATTSTPPRVQLTIPLDAVDDDDERTGREEKVKKKKKVLRRDSMDRREALLRGKEGSRRRRRWENDHFTAHPLYAPPTSADWIPAPHYNYTAPVQYQYASLYDHPELIRRREEAAAKARASRTIPATVPRKLKERVKKAHGAAGLVEMLEREVRAFLFGEPRPGEESDGEKKEEEEEDADMVMVGDEVVSDEDASSEEEIVFVSKRERGQKKPAGSAESAAAIKKSVKMHDRGWIQRLVFEGAVEESFARWIVHTIAGYYGLTSWSVSSSSMALEVKGKQEMRYSFVGMKTWEQVKDRRPLYLQL